MNRGEGGEQTVENSKIGSGSRKRFARPKPPKVGRRRNYRNRFGFVHPMFDYRFRTANPAGIGREGGNLGYSGKSTNCFDAWWAV